jgi:hypothetical protein
LTTLTGGAKNQSVTLYQAGSGTTTLTHGTGTDALSLPCAASDSLTTGQSLKLQFNGTFWHVIGAPLNVICPSSVKINGGTAITAQTGTGGTVVMSASPTFTGTVNGITASMVGAVPTTRTLTGGTGIAALGDLSADRTIAVDSTEQGFLTAGALTCGASTNGKMMVHTTPLEYCDNTATPVLRYAAYGDSAGKASTAAAADTATTAANLSGTPALPNGTTATTQSANDNSAKLGTTAYADAISTALKLGILNQSYNYLADSGAADAYVVTLSPAAAAYTTGMVVRFKATNANTTTTPTVNVNGLGAKTITKNQGAAMAANDIKAGGLIAVQYDGTNFQMLSQSGIASATVPTGTGIVRNSMAASELSGDATTSGSNAVTLAAQYKKLSCQPGLGDGLNAIPAGTYLQTTCYNDTGVTVTITGIKCFTDNSGTSTLNATNGAATALLTGAVTCTSSFAAGTQSGTTTIASGDFIKFTFVADGTSKQTSWVVTATY